MTVTEFSICVYNSIVVIAVSHHVANVIHVGVFVVVVCRSPCLDHRLEDLECFTLIILDYGAHRCKFYSIFLLLRRVV